MSNFWALVILALGSYLFGNINWALIISKIKKTDIRNLGSGNPGTLNMSRNLGLKAGLLTFFLDIMKGVVPTLIAFFVFLISNIINKVKFKHTKLIGEFNQQNIALCYNNRKLF